MAAKQSLYVLALIFCTISAFGQSQTIGPNGEGSFIAGPQGVPVMVLNDANSWSQPLTIYKNSSIEIIIPDIRTAGWAASYAGSFKKEGIYLTYLYIYRVKSHRTIREILYVNTRTRIAVVIENAFTLPTPVDLCKPDPSMPIDRITSIVEEVTRNYHGQSIGDTIAMEEFRVARMAACQSDRNSHDCTMSDEEFRKKYPVHARSTMDKLLAQLAPMTARPSNLPCKGVSTVQRAASPSTGGEGISQQPPQKAAIRPDDEPAAPIIQQKAASVGTSIDILSDTQGFDFRPYLAKILREVYTQWLPLIPAEARSPQNKQGTTEVHFTINHDGTVASIHLDSSTGDDALNRAASGSLTGVGHFPPLPDQFHGPNLELRIHYLVNKSTE